MAKRFSHWLIRTVGYEALLLAQRRSIHATVGETIEAASAAAGGGSARDGTAPATEDEIRSSIVAEDPQAALWAAVAQDLAHHWGAAGRRRRQGLFLALAARDADRHSRYRECLSLSTHATEALGSEGDSVAVAYAWLVHGRIRNRTGSPTGALEAFANAGRTLDLARGAEAEVVSIRLRSSESHVLAQTGRTEEARALARSALEAARAFASPAEQANCLSALGTALDTLGEFDAALERFEASLAIRRASGDAFGIATNLNQIGNVLGSRGERQRAAPHLAEALAIKRELGDRFGEAVSLTGLGLADWARGDLDLARERLEAAMDLRIEVGDRMGIAWCLHDLALVCWSRGDYGGALSRYEASLGIRREIGDPRGEAMALTNLGNTYWSLGEFEKAEAMYRKSLEIGERLSDAAGQSANWTGIASVRELEGRVAEALDAAERAVALCRAVGMRGPRSDALSCRAIAYHRFGRRNEAEADALEAMEIAAETNYEEAVGPARIALALARGDEAPAREALASARARGRVDLACDALLAIAEIRASSGDAAAAREAASEAATHARERGMKGVLRRAESFVADPDVALASLRPRE